MPERTYHGGIPAQGTPSAHVKKLEANSFAELVSRYFDQAIPLKLSRSAYLALPKKQRDAIKSVAYVTACSFKDLGGRRCDDNAHQLQLVFFDIDEGDLSRQIFSAPQTLADQLDGINFVLYTTANHTPSAPRLRLMVDIEPMPLSAHRRAVAHVACLLGVDDKWEGFRESHVISQPMYRPVVFEGDTSSPILISRTSGRAMLFAEVPERQDDPYDKESRRYAADFSGIDEDLEFLPLNVDMSEVKDALYKIDPDCGYMEWCHIACALRHQFRSEEDAAEAFDLYDDWSSTALVRYENTDATFAKWRSFRPCPAGRQPITIRSLFKYAIDAGWDNSAMSEKSVQSFDEWVAAADNPSKLLAEFATKIAAMPFPSAVQDAMLAEKVRKKYNQLSGANVTATTFLKQLRSENRDVQVETTDSKPPWVRPFVYVAADNSFVNTSTMTHLKPEAFNALFGHHLMPAVIEVGGNSKPYAQPTDYALHTKQIPKAVAEIYDPRQAGTEPIFVKNGEQFLNTYRATYPDPDADTSEEAGEIFRSHLSRLIREPEYVDILIDFFAFLVQHPGVKIRWAPVIQSVHGAGKGLVTKAMGAVLGRGNVKPVSNNIIASQWNDWAQGAQLIVVEEIHVSGQNRKAVMDGLKEMVTNDELPINKRSTSATYIENLINAIFFTNEESALAIASTERRYFILKSPLRTKEQVDKIQAEGGFLPSVRLHEDLASGLRHYLLHHKISKSFNPNGNAPNTKYQSQMADDSENPIKVAIREIILNDKHPGICREVILQNTLRDQLGRMLNGSPLPRWLRELGYEVWRAHAQRFNGEHQSIWVPIGYDDTLLGDPREIITERENRGEAEL